jgi:sterol 24-C-methyltransferase
MVVTKSASTSTTTDGRVNSRIENYTAFWEKDSAKDSDVQKANRVENYTDVINGEYLTYRFIGEK